MKVKNCDECPYRRECKTYYGSPACKQRDDKEKKQ